MTDKLKRRVLSHQEISIIKLLMTEIRKMEMEINEIKDKINRSKKVIKEKQMLCSHINTDQTKAYCKDCQEDLLPVHF